jgi:chromosome partitioning protein
MARAIVLCNQKGGVAKTTTAINISTYLALEHKKTLLIDADPQANATSGIGIEKHSVANNIYQVLLGHTPIRDAIVSTQIENLSLVPSNINLTGAEIELVSLIGREYRLKTPLDAVRSEYDFIIIDCPPSLSLLTINGLCAANSVLIPIQCEYYALEGLGQLMNTVNLVRENLNHSLEIEGVLLTMADFRTNLSKEIVKEVRNYFGDKVYKTIIPRSIRLSEAPSFGKPIALYDNHSSGATKYRELVGEILGIESQQITEQIVMKMEENLYGKEIGEGIERTHSDA